MKSADSKAADAKSAPAPSTGATATPTAAAGAPTATAAPASAQKKSAKEKEAEREDERRKKREAEIKAKLSKESKAMAAAAQASGAGSGGAADKSEMLSVLYGGNSKGKKRGKDDPKNYVFWDTQPVPKLNDKPADHGPIENKQLSEVRTLSVPNAQPLAPNPSPLGSSQYLAPPILGLGRTVPTAQWL